VCDGDVHEIIGTVGRCRTIDVSSQPLEILEKVPRVVQRPLEHEMLEEMGEAALVPLFILGTNVIPKV
jgi:hypothetical protein